MNPSMKNRLSIITICFNAQEYIGDTLNSIRSQTVRPYEYIIVDGKSTDNTLDIIRKYQGCIDHLVCEKDSGISEAMNKGISLSSGDYVYFLHADDYLSDNESLAKIDSCLDNTDIQCFNILYKTSKGVPEKKPRGFNSWFWFKTGILHQASICKSTLFDNLGGFDEQLRIAMDYDFFLRAYSRNIAIKHHDFSFCVMRDTGLSSRNDWPSIKTRFIEEKKVHIKNKPPVLIKYAYRIFWPTYILYRKLKLLL